MKRFDSRKELLKIPAVDGVKLGVLSMDIAVAYATMAMIEQDVLPDDVKDYEKAAALRASMAVIEHAAAALVGVVTDNVRNIPFPVVPRGLGRCCHYCGCSQNDACTCNDGRACSWSPKSLMGVRDICTACDEKGLADGGKTSIQIPGKAAAQ